MPVKAAPEHHCRKRAPRRGRHGQNPSGVRADQGERAGFFTPLSRAKARHCPRRRGEADLFLPESDVMDQVKNLARSLDLSGRSPWADLTVLGRFFRENFTYSLKPDRAGGKGSPLVRFLFHSKTGHCEYFATASVLLLRAAGIPARYVFGYLARTGEGGWTPVRERHAHAWVLARVGGRWVDFDPTPPGWLGAEDEKMSMAHYLVDGFYFLGFRLAGLGRALANWDAKSYLPFVLAVLILILIVRVLFQLKGQKRVKNPLKQTPNPEMEKKPPTLFEGMEAVLNEMGYVRGIGETPKNWLARLANQPLLKNRMESAQKAVALYYRSRFAPDSFTKVQEKEMENPGPNVAGGHEIPGRRNRGFRPGQPIKKNGGFSFAGIRDWPDRLKSWVEIPPRV